MPPKAPPSAGVKKKIVRTIRKTVPKAKAPLPETTPPATAADAAVEPAATGATAVTEVTATAITTSTTAIPPPDTAAADTTPKASEPAASGTPAAAEPSAAKTTPDALEPAAAATETPAPEPAAPETTPEPNEPAATKPPAKITTRVRKVVKKVIVKRTPKPSAAAEEAEKAEEKAVSSPAAAAQNPSPAAAAAASEAPAQQEEDGDASADQVKGDQAAAAAAVAEAGDAGLSEGRRRRKTEIFIGGLDRDAKEEDLRKVFGKAGEIVEVRLMIDSKTGKNKGYAFVRYAEPAQAKKAVSEFAKVEVCGKLCGAAALEGKDTIFLGNIDKKWKKEDISKLLEENGIEKIDTLTLMADPHNAELNRGFAFLELETNRDAQLAYKKLQKKDAFGKGRNVKVAWAEPLNDPDEEEMQKVKSVYVDGIPSSWDEDKVRESFKKFGDIERIVLARNIQSAKRKDFAFVNYTTREAALLCIESFDKAGLTDNGSKVNAKVSLAKPVQKDKQNKGGSKFSNKDKIKEKPKAVDRNTTIDISSNKGYPLKGDYTTSGGDKKSSTTRELLHVLREQAAWKQEPIGYARGPTAQDYTHALHGGKRAFSALGDDAPHSDLRGYPRARLDSSFPVTSASYAVLPDGMAGSSLPYYQRQGFRYATGALSGASDDPRTLQGRQGGLPYGSGRYY